jgi:hypothetical protein
LEKTQVIAAICGALVEGHRSAAVDLLERGYPFAPEIVTKRRFRPLKYTRTFICDGFIDRYSGNRLVFPPVLRMLSHALGDRFPFHPNWKTQVTHPAYWEVGATIDHLVPVTRGGPDDPSNWVTTSMARNSAKMNWTLSELGWELQPQGNYQAWDGLLPWCVEYSKQHPDALADSGIRQWVQAGQTAHEEFVTRLRQTTRAV